MISPAPLLLIALLAIGCGSNEATAVGALPAQASAPAAGPDSANSRKDPGTGSRRTRRSGTVITVGRSPFGRILLDSRERAVYVFERDPNRRTVCYGSCAEAWPPVLTKGTPRARGGAKSSLLGSIRRRGGRRQVTYAGKPLYYYAHEAPGEVRCHNVDLNGGYWWVVGPNGRRRP